MSLVGTLSLRGLFLSVPGSKMTVCDKVLKYEADGDPHEVHVNDMALGESYGNHCGPKVKPLYGDDYGKGKNLPQCLGVAKYQEEGQIVGSHGYGHLDHFGHGVCGSPANFYLLFGLCCGG